MSVELNRALADLVLVCHFAFVLFVAGGALLVWRWPRLAWLHLPCVVWGVLVMFSGWICPLTPLESALRGRAGGAGIGPSFTEHYLLPLIYPAALTRAMQIGFGLAALAINVLGYALLLARRRSRRRAGAG